MWRLFYQVVNGLHVLNCHQGMDNSLVGTLVENNTVFPIDLVYDGEQSFALIVLFESQDLYDVCFVVHLLYLTFITLV